MGERFNNTSAMASLIMQLCLFDSGLCSSISSDISAGQIKKIFNNISKENFDKFAKSFSDMEEKVNAFNSLVDTFNEMPSLCRLLKGHLAEMLNKSAVLKIGIYYANEIKDFADINKFFGILFIVMWYHEPDRTKYRSNSKNKIAEIIINEKNIWNGFNKCVSQGLINLPVTLDELKKIVINDSGKFSDNIFEEDRLSFLLNPVFAWGQSLSFVNFVCGKYLYENFTDATIFADDNRGWDYDHLYPKSKIDNHSPFYRLVWSSANNVPIALTTNREKQDIFPNCHYPGTPSDKIEKNQSQLYLEPAQNIENWEKDQGIFVNFAWQRFLKMYKAWYEALAINELIKMDRASHEKAKNAIDKVIQELKLTPGTYSIRYLMDSREYPITQNAWSEHEWFLLRFQAKDKSEACLTLATTYKGEAFEIGIRKDSLISMARGIDWYKEDGYFLSTTEIAKAVDELQKRINLNN